MDDLGIVSTFFFSNINQGPSRSTVDSLSLEEQDSSCFWQTLAASQGPSGPPKLDGLYGGTSTHSIAPPHPPPPAYCEANISPWSIT